MGDRHVPCALWREFDPQQPTDGHLILFHLVLCLARLVEVSTCFVPRHGARISFFVVKQSNGHKEEKSIRSKVSTCNRTTKCLYTPKPCVPRLFSMLEWVVHTSRPQGCTQVSPNETSTLVTSTNCTYVNADQGCIVMDPSSASFGAGFANISGGAFVTEFASSGIRCVNYILVYSRLTIHSAYGSSRWVTHLVRAAARPDPDRLAFPNTKRIVKQRKHD